MHDLLEIIIGTLNPIRGCLAALTQLTSHRHKKSSVDAPIITHNIFGLNFYLDLECIKNVIEESINEFNKHLIRS